MLAAYRATGADPPFGDARRAHGTPMEGYYWRFTDPARGEVLIALCGVSRDRGGRGWGTVALAHHPTGALATVSTPDAAGDPARLGVTAGETGGDDVVRGDAHSVRFDLGPEARLEAELHDVVGWPHRLWGGVGAGHVIPGLSQYWLPWCLAARVTGAARIGGRDVPLDGAVAYAEKNWGTASRRTGGGGRPTASRATRRSARRSPAASCASGPPGRARQRWPCASAAASCAAPSRWSTASAPTWGGDMAAARRRAGAGRHRGRRGGLRAAGATAGRPPRGRRRAPAPRRHPGAHGPPPRAARVPRGLPPRRAGAWPGPILAGAMDSAAAPRPRRRRRRRPRPRRGRRRRGT